MRSAEAGSVVTDSPGGHGKTSAQGHQGVQGGESGQLDLSPLVGARQSCPSAPGVGVALVAFVIENGTRRERARV